MECVYPNTPAPKPNLGSLTASKGMDREVGAGDSTGHGGEGLDPDMGFGTR